MKSAVDQINEIFRVFKASDGKIRPHFILTGPSGSGKSFNVLQKCGEHNLSYIEINAAQLTKEGLSGNSLSKALSPIANYANNLVVCFVDEFDKLFISGNQNSDHAHESTTGVQNEFLRVLESRVTSVFGDYGKYREITVDNVLFVFAGAFNGEEYLTAERLQQIGLKTEFLGRVGIVLNMVKTPLETMLSLVEESEVVKDYCDVYDVPKEQVVRDLKEAVKNRFETNIIGVRLITSLAHQYFLNGGKIPEQEPAKKKVSAGKKIKLSAS